MSQDRVMLLIDADNVSVDVMEQAVRLLLNQHGALHVRRAYCTAEGALKHQAAFKRLGIKPMVNLAAGKNSTDIAMAVDAIDLVLAERPDVVVIASSDSDFAPLVQRLREKGCVVRGIGQRGKTGDETQDVYDDFTVLEHRKPSGAARPATSARSAAPAASLPVASPRAVPDSPSAPARKGAARKSPARAAPEVEAAAVAPKLADRPDGKPAGRKTATRRAALPEPALAAAPGAAPAEEAADPGEATAAAAAPARKSAKATGRATAKSASKTAAKPAARTTAASKTASKPARKAAPARGSAQLQEGTGEVEPAASPARASRSARASAAGEAGAPAAASAPAPAAAPASPDSLPLHERARLILACMPELQRGETVELRVASQRLREAGLMGRSGASTKLLGQFPELFELMPRGQPNHLRLRR